MARSDAQPTPWPLLRRQHWVITAPQLLALGYTKDAIYHRVRTGRLHRIHVGVYAVGRAELTREGYFMAAVLACGDGAALSHDSAAAHLEIRSHRHGPIHVSVPAGRRHPRRPGISVHRRTNFETTTHRDIPITSPACTLTDLATRLSGAQLERAVNEAANRDLIDPEKLRAGLDGMPRRPGLGTLRAMLDRDTFAITDSRLEQRFLRIARRAGLPPPQTQTHVNGCRVDFYWPDLKLVVETDSLRYHRMPAQQASDRRRDHAHIAVGLIPLRFTHAQVWFDADHVEQTLRSVATAPRRRASA